jgi:hypothetical protein
VANFRLDFEDIRKAPGYKDPRSAYMKAYHARRVAEGTSHLLIAKKPRASRKTPVARQSSGLVTEGESTGTTLPPMPAAYRIPPNKAQGTKYIVRARTPLASADMVEENLNDRHGTFCHVFWIVRIAQLMDDVDPQFSARNEQDFDVNEFQFGSIDDDDDEAQHDNQYGEHRDEPDSEDMGDHDDHDAHHEVHHESGQDADHESVDDEMW